MKITWRRASALLIVFVLSTTPALAQQDALSKLIARGAAAGIDEDLLLAVEHRAAEQGLEPAQRVEILTKGVALAEQGLPAEGVLQKALEGVAKRVPTPRMVSVLDRMQKQTVEAGRVVDVWLRGAEGARIIVEVQTGDPRGKRILVQNVAEAFVHDVPRSTVDAVLDQLSTRSTRSSYGAAEVGTALGVLADLPTARDDATATADLLVSALNAGYSQAEIRQLPLAVRAAEQRGGSAAQIAREVAGDISRGDSADDVLRNLFGGELPGEGAGLGGRGSGQAGPPSDAGPPPGVGPGAVGENPGRGNENDRGRGRDN